MKWGIEAGTVVYNEYHSIRRYGIVEEKRIAEDRWAYCKVKWFNDEVYESAMLERESLCHINHTLKEYRVDYLRRIDLHTEISTLENIRHELTMRNKKSKKRGKNG
jgi:hypothetical protein